MGNVIIIIVIIVIIIVIIVIVSFIGKIISAYINITAGTAQAMWTKVVSIYTYTHCINQYTGKSKIMGRSEKYTLE